MNHTIHLVIIVVIFLLVSTPISTLKAQNKSNSPVFTDNGKTLDSLQKVYKCETIEYKNSADKKIVDSCLTVYLINSTRILSDKDVNKNAHQLKSVAAAIMHVLTQPQDYKTIYVFFVNRFGQNGSEKTIHTAGLEMSTKEL